jgi:predicted transcriptional regulator
MFVDRYILLCMKQMKHSIDCSSMTNSERRELALRLFSEGVSRYEISDRLGVGLYAINQFLAGKRAPKKDRGDCYSADPRFEVRNKTIIESALAGKDNHEIAESLGITVVNVAHIIYKSKYCNEIMDLRKKERTKKKYFVADLLKSGLDTKEAAERAGVTTDYVKWVKSEIKKQKARQNRADCDLDLGRKV